MVESRLNFERTYDAALIKFIVTHPKVWQHVTDDFAPRPELWEPGAVEEAWYVLAFDDGELLGLFMFFPENTICWRSHICMLPGAYGPKAEKACREVFLWLWENSSCWRIIGSIPDYNRTAISFAERCGMTRYGTNPQSYVKNGKLLDQVLLGISKTESPCLS